MSVVTVYDASGLENWAKAADLALQGADFTPALRQCSVAIRGDALQNFQNSSSPDGQSWPPLKHPRPSSQGADKPLLDRGILAGSITGRGQNNFEELTPHSLAVGSNLEYARLQQEGGVVTPKNVKWLTIPVTRKARRTPARKFPGLFKLKGKQVLATKKGKGFEAQFILVGSVKIPARAFLGFGPRLAQKIDDILGDFVERFQSK
jgi:phage gpG-like protein